MLILTPCYRQEPKQEAESRWVPPRVRSYLSENIASCVLVLLENKKRNAAREEHRDMDHGICAGNLRQPGSVQTVDKGMEDGQSGHHPDDMPLKAVSNHILHLLMVPSNEVWQAQTGSYLSRRVREIRTDGHSGQQHLRSTIARRGATADLADEIQPA